MNLVIVESPTKAKTLAKILKDDSEWLKTQIEYIRDRKKSSKASKASKKSKSSKKSQKGGDIKNNSNHYDSFFVIMIFTSLNRQ